MATVVAEVGYAATTIAQISARARVSPRTFYEHFDDKEHCYLTAYDAFAAYLFAGVDPGDPGPTGNWQEFLATALGSYLHNLERDPLVARAFLIEIEVAGPAARRRRHEAYAGFAALLRERHEMFVASDPALVALPERLYLAIVHGVRATVCHELDLHPQPRLTALGDDLLLWITATFQGAAGASLVLGAGG